MRVPYSWLGEFVELSSGPDETAEMLTAAGMKVEKIHRPGEGVEGVVVGRVVRVDGHPNAERLVVVDVDTGGRERRIVCGASNFKPGDLVPVAVPGSELPGLGTLSARPLRGITSDGMLCSGKELGAGDDHSGILILPASAQPGEDVKRLLGLDEVVLELEITPNRPDAMSLLGVAREVAACTGAKFRGIEGFTDRPSELHPASSSFPVQVQVLDEIGCPRYLARVIEGVKVADSPEWAKQRLRMAGLRPISNVVDATNYALWVTGHPMHAFDLDRLQGRKIVVRKAVGGEKITTIDGQERSLDADDLVIADGAVPVALAGVMGGEQSGVGGSTKTVVLESAFFEPRLIYRTSQRHGLRSESSARFERGADRGGVEAAARYAASLIVEWAGGRVLPEVVDIYPAPVERVSIRLRPERANLVLGTDLSVEAMSDALGKLGLEPTTRGDAIEVRPPTRRGDLRLEEDLVEEVARVFGYDRIPTTLPSGENRAGSLPRGARLTRKVKNCLAGAGLSEAKTSILISPAAAGVAGFPSGGDGGTLMLSNPLSSDEALLRPSLLPGLLTSLAHNFSRRYGQVRLFEAGSVFLGGPDERREPGRLAMVLGGNLPRQWHSEPRSLDFFDLKGVVEGLVAALHLRGASFIATKPPGLNHNPVTTEAVGSGSSDDRQGQRENTSQISPMPFHPGRIASLMIGGKFAGLLGQLSPAVMKFWDLPMQAYAAELDLDLLLAGAPGAERAMEAPRFPAVLLDIAVSVPEAQAAGEILETARASAGEFLESIELIDVYRGEQVGSGRKSLALALAFRHPERTLKDSEALKVRDAVMAAIASRHGGQIRAG